MKIRFIVTLIFVYIVLDTSTAFSGDGFYLNPGFKFSYIFGDHGGYTMGLEISYTSYSAERIYGIVASADYCRNAERFRYHLGGEYQVVELGPTFINENGSHDLGISVTPYFGVFVIPYYCYTFRSAKPGLHELGSFLKLPILLKGSGFHFGG